MQPQTITAVHLLIPFSAHENQAEPEVFAAHLVQISTLFLCCSCGMQEQFCFMPVSVLAAVVLALNVFFIHLAPILDICVLSGGRFSVSCVCICFNLTLFSSSGGDASVAVALRC